MGKPLDDPNRITPAEAAYILRMDRESVCECMKQNKFPVSIGVAFLKPGGKNYTYYIYRNKVEELCKFWGYYD